jgi:hypothetical protein
MQRYPTGGYKCFWAAVTGPASFETVVVWQRSSGREWDWVVKMASPLPVRVRPSVFFMNRTLALREKSNDTKQPNKSKKKNTMKH